jgi:putative acetyltransferase
MTPETDPTTRMAARLAARSAALVAGGAMARADLGGLTLRDVSDDDGAGLAALIGAAYDEFACGPMDPGGFDADLDRPATHAARRGRRWWVVTGAEDDGTILGSVRHSPVDARGVVELQRLYLAPAVRGLGLAEALVEGVADEARLLGAHLLEAWSDTRLVRAHARYLAMGFTLATDTRELHDPAKTTEARFDLDLRPRGSDPSSSDPSDTSGPSGTDRGGSA